jgi:hypothetical protein
MISIVDMCVCSHMIFIVDMCVCLHILFIVDSERDIVSIPKYRKSVLKRFVCPSGTSSALRVPSRGGEWGCRHHHVPCRCLLEWLDTPASGVCTSVC